MTSSTTESTANNLNPSPEADAWWDTFAPLITSFYEHAVDDVKKLEFSTKIEEAFKSWPAFFQAFPDPINAEKLHFTFAIAHFYLLNDEIFPLSEGPMKIIFDTVPRDSWVLWLNVLEKIEPDMAAIISAWLSKNFPDQV